MGGDFCPAPRGHAGSFHASPASAPDESSRRKPKRGIRLPDGVHSVRIPLKKSGEHILLPVLVGGKGEKPLLADVAHGVSLNATTIAGLAASPRALRTRLGRGLSGPIEGRVDRLSGFLLGGHELRNLVVNLPDSEFENPRHMDSYNGNLGVKVLSRFEVTFDYKNQRMFLEPTPRTDTPSEWNNRDWS